MKIKDYEQAIIDLSCGIVIDEFKLRKGHVRRCHGHMDSMLLMWDENGRAFSHWETEAREITQDTHDSISESEYERNTVYDIVPLKDQQKT